jgi:UDP-N-acetylglucosamine diphosphorylase / glucose-1-phosphate thymidylyltransferase / UDP-N-acetylgalactosamine diphosphorylase / glucosamine-1-phosphate N-acetyltransferase / galactosamine-1-phosphate N-acetyltransferase|uniref:acyltransferase n=1 Tax=Cephaloticoccus sp. TaxID=1985742 RepID=UPI00404B0F05
MQAADFFTLPTSLATFSTHFSPTVEPWDWIKQIVVAFAANPAVTERPVVPPGVHIEGSVYLHPTVKLPHAATIIGPVWIGARTEIRPGAYIRGNVIVGEDCVLGNACEFKNCLLMDRVQVPHFNYVGDSILGSDSHLGAGVVCSNFRLDQKPVLVRLPDRDVETGLRKFGAIIGEKAEVGCNAVLMPGTLLGRRSLVMPLTPFGGYLPDNMMARDRPSMSQVPRRD